METGCRGSPPDEHLLTDLLPADARVVLVEPRRMRDRAPELLAEEADLAGTLAKTWGGRRATTFPRLHLPPDRLLAGVDGLGAGRSPTAPEGPDTPLVAATAWAPVVGEGDALVRRLRDTADRRLPGGRRRRR